MYSTHKMTTPTATVNYIDMGKMMTDMRVRVRVEPRPVLSAEEKKEWVTSPHKADEWRWIKKEVSAVPSSPPWTTFSGRIHCHKDSWVGRCLAEDPRSGLQPLVDKDKKPIPGKEDWVNGLWTAPENWIEWAKDKPYIQ